MRHFKGKMCTGAHKTILFHLVLSCGNFSFKQFGLISSFHFRAKNKFKKFKQLNSQVFLSDFQ